MEILPGLEVTNSLFSCLKKKKKVQILPKSLQEISTSIIITWVTLINIRFSNVKIPVTYYMKSNSEISIIYSSWEGSDSSALLSPGIRNYFSVSYPLFTKHLLGITSAMEIMDKEEIAASPYFFTKKPQTSGHILWTSHKNHTAHHKCPSPYWLRCLNGVAVLSISSL